MSITITKKLIKTVEVARQKQNQEVIVKKIRNEREKEPNNGLKILNDDTRDIEETKESRSD